MPAMESHRICCVCLIDESEKTLTSVFENKIATAIFKISGIAVVDRAGGSPCLICESCVWDVKNAEYVRLQIIKGQKRLAELNSKTETELIHQTRRELVLNQPSFPFTLSKSTLDKVAEWRHNQELLNSIKKPEESPKESPAEKVKVKPEPVSPIRKNSETKKVAKKASVKREKTTVPVMKFSAKKEIEQQPMVVIRDLEFVELVGADVKTEKVRKPPKPKTKRNHIPTSFECDSCQQCFPSVELLDLHMPLHSLSWTDPTALFEESPPLLITEVHEASDYFSDDVILIPPKEPEVINVEDEDENVESLLRLMY